MGAWGPAIFSDDYACDIRDEYNALLMLGKTNEEATEKLIKSAYSEMDSNDDYEATFWFALALTQWKKGRLLEPVKQKALELIDSGRDQQWWKETADRKNYEKRLQVLERLKETLQSPMPPPKKIRKPTVVHSPWKVGDLLAYKITYEDISHPEYLNQYVLLRVLKILKHPFYPGIDTPWYDESVLLGVYNWSGDTIPDVETIEKLDYLVISDFNDPVFGRKIHTCMNLCFSKTELKRHEILVLERDESYTQHTPEFFKTQYNQYGWYHFDNLEIWITGALKRVSKES